MSNPRFAKPSTPPASGTAFAIRSITRTNRGLPLSAVRDNVESSTIPATRSAAMSGYRRQKSCTATPPIECPTSTASCRSRPSTTVRTSPPSVSSVWPPSPTVDAPWPR